jgi:hypothetical protein
MHELSFLCLADAENLWKNLLIFMNELDPAYRPEATENRHIPPEGESGAPTEVMMRLVEETEASWAAACQSMEAWSGSSGLR